MGEVVDLGAASSRSTRLLCRCGGAWFSTNVCIENGRATGYTHPLVCVECGKEVPA